MFMRHKKSGGIYRIMMLAIREADLEPMVAYAEEDTGFIFVRPAKEFFDGRFEVFIPSPESDAFFDARDDDDDDGDGDVYSGVVQ